MALLGGLGVFPETCRSKTGTVAVRRCEAVRAGIFTNPGVCSLGDTSRDVDARVWPIPDLGACRSFDAFGRRNRHRHQPGT